jgi:quercetin dioxygenase-like cupin family protein
MSVSAAPATRSRLPSALVPVVIALVALAGLLVLPRLATGNSATAPAAHAPAGSTSARAVPPFPNRAPAPVWGTTVKTRVPLQQRLDPMPPDAPYTFRVTELEMEPGAKIFEHRQIGVGAHIVTRGSITIDDLDHGTSATYRPGQSYFEGLDPLHRAQNDGREANRVLMFDILPASRGFDGQQRFTSEGRHNEGEVRSGPYVQIPLRDLPEGPLMLRVTEMAFGPKAKTEVHFRLGPTIFFVQEGTATVRKDWDNSSNTYGTNGYFYESGREPFILENKPARPATFIAVEILPAAIGDGPSTIPAAD